MEPGKERESGRRLLTVQEAARALGMGYSTLRRRIAAGELEAIRLGRSRRIRPEELDAFIERLARASAR